MGQTSESPPDIPTCLDIKCKGDRDCRDLAKSQKECLSRKENCKQKLQNSDLCPNHELL